MRRLRSSNVDALAATAASWIICSRSSCPGPKNVVSAVRSGRALMVACNSGEKDLCSVFSSRKTMINEAGLFASSCRMMGCRATVTTTTLARRTVTSVSTVAGAQIPPRRPPREEIGVLGIELAAQIHELRAEESLEQRALLGSLAHGVRLALFGMHVDFRARDVHVAAENQVSPLRRQPRRPIAETRDEGKLGGGCLELLEADHVRPIALQPLAQLRGAGPNAVDVPGRDFHAGMISP